MIFNDHFSVVLYVFDTCILKNHFFFSNRELCRWTTSKWIQSDLKDKLSSKFFRWTIWHIWRERKKNYNNTYVSQTHKKWHFADHLHYHIFVFISFSWCLFLIHGKKSQLSDYLPVVRFVTNSFGKIKKPLYGCIIKKDGEKMKQIRSEKQDNLSQ